MYGADDDGCRYGDAGHDPPGWITARSDGEYQVIGEGDGVGSRVANYTERYSEQASGEESGMMPYPVHLSRSAYLGSDVTCY